MEDSLRVTITCTICAVVIIGLSAYIIDSYLGLTKLVKKDYSLMFDVSDLTYQHVDSGATFVIDNMNQAGNKPMSVSDLVDNAVGNDYSIYASMFSNGGQLIDLDIRFDNQRVFQFHTSLGQPALIEISVNKQFELGEYRGWFILPGQNGFSVPITISTPPLIVQSMAIIIIGALTSIIVIELSKYVNNEQRIKLRDSATSKINNIIGHQVLTNLSSADQITVSKLKEVEAMSDLKVTAYHAQYAGPAAALKNAFLSFLPALFALALAFAAFINNEMVMKITVLDIQSIIALFLLGAGIESIKELFNRMDV
jgi:hypothetical protein